jgi:hypothetical protein
VCWGTGEREGDGGEKMSEMAEGAEEEEEGSVEGSVEEKCPRGGG